jgi:hypothetical protein
MARDPDGPMPDQPGINGVQYAASTHYLYYTTTAQELFMQVRVGQETNDPAGEPEFAAGGMMGDDFCIDDNAGVAYIATHRQNTIDRVSLNPSENTTCGTAWPTHHKNRRTRRARPTAGPRLPKGDERA